MIDILMKIRNYRKCERCGLMYSKKEKDCIHCSGLSDMEVESLKRRHESEGDVHTRLGRTFLLIAVLLIGGLLFLLATG